MIDSRRSQTFHVWLPSHCAFGAKFGIFKQHPRGHRKRCHTTLSSLLIVANFELHYTQEENDLSY